MQGSSDNLLARVFGPNGTDRIDFGALTPLRPQADWSVVALICPTASQQYGAIISNRSAFSRGEHSFTFWLKDGAGIY